jgi:hypothetical protein
MDPAQCARTAAAPHRDQSRSREELAVHCEAFAGLLHLRASARSSEQHSAALTHHLFVRFRERGRFIRSGGKANDALHRHEEQADMRKFKFILALGLSAMTLGFVAEASPAFAHTAIVAGEDDDDDDDETDDTISDSASSAAPAGGVATGAGGTASFAGEDDDDDDDETDDTVSVGGSSAPEGGVATGAGGTATDDASPFLPMAAAGAVGAGLVGLSAARRRHAINS